MTEPYVADIEWIHNWIKFKRVISLSNEPKGDNCDLHIS